MAYLEKHKITPMLNGIVNELVTELPDDPISFLINGLLKEANARGQEPALLQRLLELKQTLLVDQKAATAVAAEKAALQEESEKLKNRITHLCRTLDEMEKGGASAAPTSAANGVVVPSGLIGVPPGHTAFSWAGGVETGAPVTNGVAPAAPAAPVAGDLAHEKFSNRVAVATLLKASTDLEGERVSVCGWIRTNRTQKKLCFISINDGSCQTSLQLVLEKDKLPAEAWEAAKGAGNGSAVRVEGCLKVRGAVPDGGGGACVWW